MYLNGLTAVQLPLLAHGVEAQGSMTVKQNICSSYLETIINKYPINKPSQLHTIYGVCIVKCNDYITIDSNHQINISMWRYNLPSLH